MAKSDDPIREDLKKRLTPLSQLKGENPVRTLKRTPAKKEVARMQRTFYPEDYPADHDPEASTSASEAAALQIKV